MSYLLIPSASAFVAISWELRQLPNLSQADFLTVKYFKSTRPVVQHSLNSYTTILSEAVYSYLHLELELSNTAV